MRGPAIMAFSAALLLAACTDSGKYIELGGGGFIFNYRISEATAGIVVGAVRTLPEGSVVEASFQDPGGGQPIVLRQDVVGKTARFDFTTPPLHGVKVDTPYAVSVRLLDKDGKELQRIDQTFRSNVDESVLAAKPLTIGPGYTPNPQLAPPAKSN